MNKGNISQNFLKLEKYSLYAIIALIVTTTLILIAYFWNFHFGFATQEKFGQFGDFVGGVLNPFIAFFALLAVWYTSKIQTDFLKSQIETNNTDKAKEHFFTLFDTYLKTLESITDNLTSSTQEYKGKQAIKIHTTGIRLDNGNNYIHCRNIKEIAEQNVNDLNDGVELKMFTKATQSYETKYLKQNEIISFNKYNGNFIVFFEDTEFFTLYYQINEENYIYVNTNVDIESELDKKTDIFDSFFRVVYHILKSQDYCPQDINYQNIRFFRAQLTEAELILISLNALFDIEGKKNLAPLLKKFGLIKNLRSENLRRLVEYRIGSECLGRKYHESKLHVAQ